MVCPHFAKIYIFGRGKGRDPLLRLTIDLIGDNLSIWLCCYAALKKISPN